MLERAETPGPASAHVVLLTCAAPVAQSRRQKRPGNLQFCDSSHLHPRQSVRRWHRTKGDGHEGVFGADAFINGIHAEAFVPAIDR